MPIYAYKCPDCGEEFERVKSIKDETIELCPKCEAEAKRQISRTSFQLRGSGWFKDGY